MVRLIFLFILFISHFAISAQEVYTVNTNVSKVEWLGRKLGGEHSGIVQVKSGKLKIENGRIHSGIVIIDMNSIQILDIESKSSNSKLMSVFESEGFFYPAKFKTAKLEIKNTKLIDEQTQEVFGTLTIKEISREIQFKTQVVSKENQLVFIGDIEIDRTDFNIKFGSGFFSSLGDNAIKDLFKITFKIAAAN